MISIKQFIQDIKGDFKERFLNFETVGGFYWMGLGLVVLVFQNHIVTLVGLGCLGYGIYAFFVNRIKQKKKEKELVDK